MTRPATAALDAEHLAVLDAALAHIDANPGEWEQSTWVCGSSACLGGRIALMAGEVDPENGWSAAAQRLLGLDPVERHPIFGAGNNRLALQVWRQLLAGEPLTDLDGADLSGARLTWADLRGANLSGANLRGATGLPAQLVDKAETEDA